MSTIKLIVGLGNPGQKYEQTRHNIGFMVVDRLTTNFCAEMANHLRWRARMAKVPGTGAILLKPQTFMNESGQSVGAALRFYKLQPEQVLVVYDDVSIPFCSLRFRMAGSAGGHNGIKSIISHLGSDRFPRLKVGIGNDTRNSTTGHVLGKFSTDECNQLENTLATAAEAVQLALSGGVEVAANTYNTRKKPTSSESAPDPGSPTTNQTEQNDE